MYYDNYTSIQVADYVVWYLKSQGKYVSGLDIHYYLYFIQKTFLDKFNYTAFDDPIYAVSWGVYIPSLNSKFIASSLPILKDYDDMLIMMTEEERLFLNSTINIIHSYSPTEARDLVREQVDWKKAYIPNNENNLIFKNEMKESFEKRFVKTQHEIRKQLKYKNWFIGITILFSISFILNICQLFIK